MTVHVPVETGPAPSTAPALCPVVVRRVEAPQVVTLQVDASELPPGRPGQFDMLYAPGVGEAAISIASHPTEPLRTYTIRDVGWVTHALTSAMPGDTVGVRGPFGRTWPTVGAEDLLVVAGGIGLPPLRGAVVDALADASRTARTLVVVGVRTTADRCLLDDLATWEADPRVELVVTVDQPDGGWRGRVGNVVDALAGLDLDPARTVALTCGPEPMMAAVADALCGRGMSPDAVHVTLERTMRCGTGTCGHCQLGPVLLCRDGPVLPWTTARPWLAVREL